MFDIVWNCKSQIFTCLRPIANLYFWLKYRLYRVFFTTLPAAVGHIVNLAMKPLISLGKSLPLCLPQNFSKGKKQIVSHNQPPLCLLLHCGFAARFARGEPLAAPRLHQKGKERERGKSFIIIFLLICAPLVSFDFGYSYPIVKLLYYPNLGCNPDWVPRNKATILGTAPDFYSILMLKASVSFLT